MAKFSLLKRILLATTASAMIAQPTFANPNFNESQKIKQEDSKFALPDFLWKTFYNTFSFDALEQSLGELMKLDYSFDIHKGALQQKETYQIGNSFSQTFQETMSKIEVKEHFNDWSPRLNNMSNIKYSKAFTENRDDEFFFTNKPYFPKTKSITDKSYSDLSIELRPVIDYEIESLGLRIGLNAFDTTLNLEYNPLGKQAEATLSSYKINRMLDNNKIELKIGTSIYDTHIGLFFSKDF